MFQFILLANLKTNLKLISQSHIIVEAPKTEIQKHSQ